MKAAKFDESELVVYGTNRDDNDLRAIDGKAYVVPAWEWTQNMEESDEHFVVRRCYDHGKKTVSWGRRRWGGGGWVYAGCVCDFHGACVRGSMSLTRARMERLSPVSLKMRIRISFHCAPIDPYTRFLTHTCPNPTQKPPAPGHYSGGVGGDGQGHWCEQGQPEEGG